ncbi:MAG: hypothetical protein KHZ62_09575 [Clostridiales bacterium]|nr:hypothetical protein [Clostridiales bacterium]
MSNYLRTVGFIFAASFIFVGIWVIKNYNMIEEYDVLEQVFVTTTNYVGIGAGIGLILQGLLTLFMTFTMAGTYENTKRIIQDLSFKKEDDDLEQMPTTDNIDLPAEKQEDGNSQ